MNLIRSPTSRRSFLKSSALFALGLRGITRGQVPIERGRFGEEDIPAAREQLLTQVNAERTRAGLSLLVLDDLACKVASEHARDMVTREFLSHWGSDGLKPYQRYSFAGGSDAVRENVSSADKIQSLTRAGVLKDLYEMHQSMIDEVPPNDGHRKTILVPQHTHVGFGIAMNGRSARLDELYLARYVEMDPIPRQAVVNTRMLVKGKLLHLNHLLNGVEVYYEPLPSPPAIEWLREARSHGLPEVSEQLRPRLPDVLFYPDGGHGSIDIDSSNRFRVRVSLSKKPGINTIMVWIKTGHNGTAFPAAQICVRVE
jgi:uncharacterized protein YkwD